ncbi:MAG: hypothetical protein K1X91_07035 [Bacteriodetes bacterium]|nr:hypothetical protein [Bacteroidota bacterium]
MRAKKQSPRRKKANTTAHKKSALPKRNVVTIAPADAYDMFLLQFIASETPHPAIADTTLPYNDLYDATP